jgi:beta-lactamase class A
MDVSTVEGWLGWLAEHPDQVAVVFDDGRGATIDHRSGEPQPLASAVKVVHLAAYATAVRDGVVSAEQPVHVGDWERWYLPGTDGGAHVGALQRLGVPHDGVRAVDPRATVPLDAVVSAMVQESDNAAPEFLVDLLGADAVSAAAASGGWPDAPVPNRLGSYLRLLDPTLTDEHEAARRYLEDPTEAGRLQALPLPGLEAQVSWAETTTSGTAGDLAALHTSLSAGDPPAAREHLEWQAPPAGYAGMGFKGGSLPGVLTEAFTVRRDDGSTGVGVLLVEGMEPQEWVATLQAQSPHQQLLFGALTDEAVAHQLTCALSSR